MTNASTCRGRESIVDRRSDIIEEGLWDSCVGSRHGGKLPKNGFRQPPTGPWPIRASLAPRVAGSYDRSPGRGPRPPIGIEMRKVRPLICAHEQQDLEDAEPRPTAAARSNRAVSFAPADRVPTQDWQELRRLQETAHVALRTAHCALLRPVTRPGPVARESSSAAASLKDFRSGCRFGPTLHVSKTEAS